MSVEPELKRLRDKVKVFADELDTKIGDLYTTAEQLQNIKIEINKIIEEISTN